MKQSTYTMRDLFQCCLDFAPLQLQLSDTTKQVPQSIKLVSGFHKGQVIYYDPILGRNHHMSTLNATQKTRCPAKKLQWIPNSNHQVLVQFQNNCFYQFKVEHVQQKSDQDYQNPIHQNFKNIQKISFSLAFQEINKGQYNRRTFLANYSNKYVNLLQGFHGAPPLRYFGFLLGLNKGEQGPQKLWRFYERCKINDFKLAYFNPTKLFFIIACNDSYTKLYNYYSYTFICGFESHYGNPIKLQVSENSTILAVGGQDDSIGVYDLRTLELIYRLQGHKSFVNNIVIDEFFSNLPDFAEQQKTDGIQRNEIDKYFLDQQQDKDQDHILALYRKRSSVKLDKNVKFYRLISGGEDGAIHLWDILIKKDVDAVVEHSHDVKQYDYDNVKKISSSSKLFTMQCPVTHLITMDQTLVIMSQDNNVHILKYQIDAYSSDNSRVRDIAWEKEENEKSGLIGDNQIQEENQDVISTNQIKLLHID